MFCAFKISGDAGPLRKQHGKMPAYFQDDLAGPSHTSGFVLAGDPAKRIPCHLRMQNFTLNFSLSSINLQKTAINLQSPRLFLGKSR